MAVVMAVLAVVGGGSGCGDGELFCDTAKKSLKVDGNEK